MDEPFFCLRLKAISLLFHVACVAAECAFVFGIMRQACLDARVHVSQHISGHVFAATPPGVASVSCNSVIA